MADDRETPPDPSCPTEFSPEMVRRLSTPARWFEVWYDVDLFDESNACIGSIVRVGTTKRPWWQRRPARLRSLRRISGDTFEVRDLQGQCVRSIVTSPRPAEPLTRITDRNGDEIASLVLAPREQLWRRGSIEVTVHGKRVATLSAALTSITDANGKRQARIGREIAPDHELGEPLASVAIVAALCRGLEPVGGDG